MNVSFEFDAEEFDELEALEGESARQSEDDVDWAHMSARFCGKIEDFASVSGQYSLDPDCYKELDIVAHIERIDVDEAHRCKGYALALLRAVCAKCRLIYAAAESESAANFWRHIGGEPVNDDTWGPLDAGFGVYCVSSWKIVED